MLARVPPDDVHYTRLSVGNPPLFCIWAVPEAGVPSCAGPRDGWKTKKIRVAVSSYVATSDKKYGGLSNPFIAWSATSRLISKDVTDREGVERVLRDEAKNNNGLLKIDTKAHYIYNKYPGSEKKDAAIHQFGDAVVAKAPTCSSAGVKILTCSLCGLSFEESVPADTVKGHHFEKGVCVYCGKTDPAATTAVSVTATAAKKPSPATGDPAVVAWFVSVSAVVIFLCRRKTRR